MKRWFRETLIALVLMFPVVFIAASYLEDLVETSSQEGSSQIVTLITQAPSRLIYLASNAGYPGIFFLMLLDSAGLPLPSEIILPLAGYLVFQGTLQYWPVVFYSTLAALLGSSADYYIGRKLGRPLITGQAKLPYVPTAQLQKVQSWFDAHGPAAVTLVRLVPAARGLISFPAGACRMNLLTFELCTLLGCLTWNVTLVYLGWWLGSSWGLVTSLVRYLTIIVCSVMIAAAFWILLDRRLKAIRSPSERAKRRSDEGGDSRLNAGFGRYQRGHSSYTVLILLVLSLRFGNLGCV